MGSYGVSTVTQFSLMLGLACGWPHCPQGMPRRQLEPSTSCPLRIVD